MSTELEQKGKKEKEAAVVLPEGVTTEMVKAWKDRYGNDKVKLATLFDCDKKELCTVVVRVPGRQERSEFEKWIDKNPDKAKEILINSCLLSPNKDEVKDNDDKFEAAFDAIAKLLRISTSTIKNL